MRHHRNEEPSPYTIRNITKEKTLADSNNLRHFHLASSLLSAPSSSLRCLSVDVGPVEASLTRHFWTQYPCPCPHSGFRQEPNRRFDVLFLYASPSARSGGAD